MLSSLSMLRDGARALSRAPEGGAAAAQRASRAHEHPDLSAQPAEPHLRRDPRLLPQQRLDEWAAETSQRLTVTQLGRSSLIRGRVREPQSAVGGRAGEQCRVASRQAARADEPAEQRAAVLRVAAHLADRDAAQRRKGSCVASTSASRSIPHQRPGANCARGCRSSDVARRRRGRAGRRAPPGGRVPRITR